MKRRGRGKTKKKSKKKKKKKEEKNWRVIQVGGLRGGGSGKEREGGREGGRGWGFIIWCYPVGVLIISKEVIETMCSAISNEILTSFNVDDGGRRK